MLDNLYHLNRRWAEGGAILLTRMTLGDKFIYDQTDDVSEEKLMRAVEEHPNQMRGIFESWQEECVREAERDDSDDNQ